MALSVINSTAFIEKANQSSPWTSLGVSMSASAKALVIAVTIYDTSSTEGIVSAVDQDGVNSFTEIIQYYDSLSDGHVSIWLLNDPDISISNFNVYFGGTVTDFKAGIVQLDGNAEVDDTTQVTIGGGSPGASVTATVSDSVMIGCALDDQSVGSKVTITDGSTSVYITDVGSDTVCMAYRVLTSSGSNAMTWADSDDDEDCVTIVANFKETSSVTTYYQSNSGIQSISGILKNKVLKKAYGVMSGVGNIIKKTKGYVYGVMTSGGAYTSTSSFFKTFLGDMSSFGDISLQSRFSKALSGIMSSDGNAVKKIYKAYYGSISFVGDLKRKIFVSFDGVMNSIGDTLYSSKFTKALLGVMDSVGSTRNKTSKFILGVFSGDGSIKKKSFVLLFGVISSIGNLNAVKTATLYIKSLYGDMTSSGLITRIISKSFSGNMTGVGDIIKKSYRLFSGSMNSVGLLETLKLAAKYFVSISGSMISEGFITRGIKRAFSGSMSGAGNIVKKSYKIFIGGITSSGSLDVFRLALKYFKSLSGSMISTGSKKIKTSKLFIGISYGVGTVRKNITKKMVGIMNSSGILAYFKKSFVYISSLSFSSGNLIKSTRKIVSGTASFAGSISRKIRKYLSGIIIFNPRTKGFGGGSVVALAIGLIGFGHAMVINALAFGINTSNRSKNNANIDNSSVGKATLI